MIDAAGNVVDLPPAARAVLDAHAPPPPRAPLTERLAAVLAAALARLGALPEQVAALKTAVAVRPAVAGGLGLLSAALAVLAGMAE